MPLSWICTHPRNTGGRPIAAPRFSVKYWPPGARVTESVPATDPVALNAVRVAVTGAVVGLDSATRDAVVGVDAAPMICDSGSGSTRISSGENPPPTAPPSTVAGSVDDLSTSRACAVTPWGVVTTRKPCWPLGVVAVLNCAQRTISAIGVPLLTATGMSRENAAPDDAPVESPVWTNFTVTLDVIGPGLLS